MRRIAVPIVLTSALALGAGLIMGPPASAVAPPVTEPATAAVSADAAPVVASVAPVPRIDYAGLAKQAIGAAAAIFTCDAFTKDGLKCEKKPTIRDVATKLKQIEAQIAQNQAQTNAALDSLQKAIDAQDLTKALKDLAPVRAHIFEAGKAWEAMSTCSDKAVTAGATCTGYAGVALPGVPVAEGLSESKEFFLGQIAKITLTIEQATEYFAGIEGQPSVGLLHNLWKSAKRQQDRDSGASSPGQLPLQPVVVTRQLATTFLPVMTYYLRQRNSRVSRPWRVRRRHLPTVRFLPGRIAGPSQAPSTTTGSRMCRRAPSPTSAATASSTRSSRAKARARPSAPPSSWRSVIGSRAMATTRM